MSKLVITGKQVFVVSVNMNGIHLVDVTDTFEAAIKWCETTFKGSEYTIDSNRHNTYSDIYWVDGVDPVGYIKRIDVQTLVEGA